MPSGVYVGKGVVVVMNSPPLVYAKVFHTGSEPDRHLRKLSNRVALLARDLAPLGDTGRLKASIKVDQNRDEMGHFTFGFKVFTDVYYGEYVHEGTGPSPRWPDGRKVMRWEGSAGDEVYRDFVMHPGIRANPFLTKALSAMAGG